MGEGPAGRPPPEPAGRAALWVWLVFNGALVAWLAFLAWWPQDEYHPALGLGEGLANIGVSVGLLCVFTVPGSLLLARRRAVGTVFGALLMAGAMFGGFVFGAVIGAGRCETCDCA